MLRTATRRFRAADIVHSTIMQGRGRGRGGRKQQHMSSTTSSSDMNNSNKGDANNHRTRRTQQHKASGRGGGRHNRSNIARSSTPNQQISHNNKPINIETTNFQSIFHNKLCRVAKYKVHAPQCSCPKVVKLRPSIYSCTNTNLQSFQNNGIECE